MRGLRPQLVHNMCVLVSPAVEGLDLEKISIEANFVPKEVEFFVEQHIQNPLKSTLGKIFYLQLKFY